MWPGGHTDGVRGLFKLDRLDDAVSRTFILKRRWKVGMWEFAHRVCARPVYTREESTLRERFPDHPTIVAIRGRGRVTLPKAARDRLSLEEGDQVLVVVGRRTLEVVPVEFVTRDQLWSLTGSVRDHIEAA